MVFENFEKDAAGNLSSATGYHLKDFRYILTALFGCGSHSNIFIGRRFNLFYAIEVIAKVIQKRLKISVDEIEAAA